MIPIELLQAIRLKGVAPIAALAEALGAEVSAIEREVARTESMGHVQKLSRGVRLTESGRSQIESALAGERAQLDPTALERIYDRFHAINSEFKQLVTDWQLREIDGEQKINDHSDLAYDRSVLDRLLALHGRFVPLSRDVADFVPRLANYSRRFEAARARIANGESRYVAAPIIDSYHTVWFEFHEELLQVTGRSRSEEAAAGRAD